MATITDPESDSLDFKREIDLSEKKEQLELLKDMVAMANSNGGRILVGVQNDGSLAGVDVSSVISFDPARLADLVFRYTSVHFAGFSKRELNVDGAVICEIRIEPADYPLVFTSPGTYELKKTSESEKPRQSTVFSQGTVYVRHGAKSELATTEDMRKWMDGKVEKVRSSWFENIVLVAKAPIGSRVVVETPGFKPSSGEAAIPVKPTSDESATLAFIPDINESHPWNQTSVLRQCNDRLSLSKKLNSADILAIRRVHNIEGRIEYFFRPLTGAPQYSTEFADWIVARMTEDPEFAARSRTEYRRRQLEMKAKPST